jgi:hypothetical protein
MAVASKRKRKIQIEGRTFYWCVKEDTERGLPELHILSPDKKFMVQYALNQSKSHSLGWTQAWSPPFVVVLGPEFGGLSAAAGWQRVRTPAWEDDRIITPAFVRRLILWCLDKDKEVVLTNWRGQTAEEATEANNR